LGFYIFAEAHFCQGKNAQTIDKQLVFVLIKQRIWMLRHNQTFTYLFTYLEIQYRFGFKIFIAPFSRDAFDYVLDLTIEL